MLRSRSPRFLFPLILGLVPLAPTGAHADGPPRATAAFTPDGRRLFALQAADPAVDPDPTTTKVVPDDPSNARLTIRSLQPPDYEVLILWTDSANDVLGLMASPADQALRAQLALPEGQGVVVTSVTSGGPAEQVGLRPNDILLKLGGKPIGQPEDLVEHLKGAGEEAMELALIRGGKPMTLRVRPRTRVTFAPAEPEAPEFYIGVSVNPVDATLRSHLADLPEGRGLVVTEVIDESPARAAGVRPGDILLSFGDTPLDSLETLSARVRARGGRPTRLTLVRVGKPMTLEVTPQSRERNEQAQGLRETGFLPWRLAGDAGNTLNLIAVPPAASRQDLNWLSPNLGMPPPAGQQWLTTLQGQQQTPNQVLTGLLLANAQLRSPDRFDSRLEELTRRVEELARAVDELRKSLRAEAGKE